MALPLPRVVADVGPGGPLVTSMRGINALQNDMLMNKIASVKAQYAPLTTQAEAASKLAYAQLMGPQFMAKLMGNQDILANIPDDQKKNILSKLQQAGMGQGMPGGNALSPGQSSPMPQPTQPNQGGNSLSGYFGNILKNILGGGNNQQAPQSQNALMQPSQMETQMPNVNAIAGIDPSSELGQATTSWQNSPDAAARAREDGMYSVPPDRELLQWYRGQQGPASPPQSAPPAFGVTPTFSENVGNYKGIVKEGEESGKIRATDINELNKVAFNGQTTQTTLDNLNKIVSSPAFEEIRQVPLAGHHELAFYAKEGTPEQQNMVGQYYTLTGNIIKDSSRDFAGQFRSGEQQLLQSMKPTPSDTVDTARGKLESLSVMNKMLTQRASLTSQYMNQYHINKLEASQMADKQVDGEKIRQDVHDTLNPTVTIKNPKTGEVMTLSISEARKRGVKNV